MGFADWFNSVKIPQVQVIESHYDSERIGSLDAPLRLCNANANILAATVSELFYPIDFISDRASKIRYFIADKKGDEVENTELNRFINNPNPLQSIGDYCYDYIFSYLSDGNTVAYRQLAMGGTIPSVGNISRIDVLQPSLLSVVEWQKISRLSITSLTALIKKAEYEERNGGKMVLSPDLISIANIDSKMRDGSALFSQSPLFKAKRPIDNLLAAYSARYNVYANNGAAGYLVKKTGSANDVMASTANRDDILKDINDRHGLTGKKNLYGVTGVPIEFINTLVTIKDLMPFEETINDAIQIAGVYQIPANLIPRTEQAKYENQAEAEKSVWENSIKSIVDVFCANTTKDLALDKAGYSIKADYSSVSVMSISKKTKEEHIGLRLDNLAKIVAINPALIGIVTPELNEIISDNGDE